MKKKAKERKNVDDHILSREERIRESREFNLLSDVFLSVALDDVPACQYIIRILTGIGDLMVKQVRTQYVIVKINSRTVRLDILAEDSEGKLYQIEIQRQDTVDHPRRVRYYGALADSEFLAKGREYFKTADPNDNSEGDLSKRVHFLKCEEGGVDIMCEVAERIEARGREQGEKRKARITTQNLYQMGMSPEKIAQAVGEDIGSVRQWLAEIRS